MGNKFVISKEDVEVSQIKAIVGIDTKHPTSCEECLYHSKSGCRMSAKGCGLNRSNNNDMR